MAQGRRAFNQGDHAAAESHFRAARSAGAHGFELLSFLGYLARERGDHDDAADHYAAALEQAKREVEPVTGVVPAAQEGFGLMSS